MGKKKQRVVNPVWERKKNAIMRNYRKMADGKNPKVPKSSIDNEMHATAQHLESDIQEVRNLHDKKFLKIDIPKRSVRIYNRSRNVNKQESIIITPSKFKRASVAAKEKVTVQNLSESCLSMTEKANAETNKYRPKLTQDHKQAKEEMDKQCYYKKKGFGVNIPESEKEKNNQKEGQRKASKKFRENKVLMSQLVNSSSSVYETNIFSECSTITNLEHSDQSLSSAYNNPITSANYGNSTFSTETSSLSIYRQQSIKHMETIRNKSKSDLSVKEKTNPRIHTRGAKLTEGQKLAKGEMNIQCYYEKKACGVIKSISCKSEKEKIDKRKKWREASRKYREKKKLSQLSNDSLNTCETNFRTPCSTTTISAHFDNSSDQFFCSGSTSPRNSDALSFSSNSSALSLRRKQGIKRVKTINKNLYLQLEKQKRINEELKRKLDKYKRLLALKDTEIIDLLSDSL